MASLKSSFNRKCYILLTVGLWVSLCGCDNVGLEKSSVYYGLAITAAAEEGSQCREHLARTAQGIRNRDIWAMKLIDASGAPTSKLYWGGTYWMGNSFQCAASMSTRRGAVTPTPRSLALHHPSTLPPFPVRYFGAYFTHDSPFMMPNNFHHEYRITLGLCLPDSCSEEEISQYLQEYFDSNSLNYQSLYNTSLTMENVKKTGVHYEWARTLIFKIFISFLISVFAVCVLSSVYEDKIQHTFITRKGNAKDDTNVERFDDDRNLTFWEQMLLCFSYSRNIKSLFNTDVVVDEKVSILPIHGLRCVLAAWIVMNHGAMYVSDYLVNRGQAFYILNDAYLQIFVNATYFVDSFIVMSAFLMGYYFLDAEKKKQAAGVKESAVTKCKTILFGIFKRMARFLPPYAVALGVAEYVAWWMKTETILWTEEKNHIFCAKYYWRNFLFYNNLYPKDEMCMNWTWFVSNDMQLFVLSLVLLVLSTSYFKLAVGIFAAILVGSNVYVGYLTYIMKFIPYLDNMWTHFDVFYSPPWNRSSVYIIGLGAGYLLRHLDGNLAMKKKTINIMYMVSVSVMAAMMLSVGAKDMSLSGSVLYMSLGKSLWAVAMAGFLVACVTENGGIVGSFLSSKYWIPFARVTFCNYLIHPIIIRAIGSTSEAGIELVVPAMIFSGIGNITISLIVSILFSLTYEFPFVKISKLLSKTDNGFQENKEIVTNKME